MKPFLKWAGNKYQIIQHIKQLLPDSKRLIEPFVGSGAVFLNTNFPSYFLSDYNADLITLFNLLKQEGKNFIEYCRTFFVPENNTAEAFYEFRKLFNSTSDSYLKSALFLYLNRHCYNGLCRFNAHGLFNTPFGKYKKPYFPELELNYFHQKSQAAIISQMDFLTALQMAEPGDVVYCDPPYVPLSAFANFTAYSAAGFTIEQQLMLADAASQLAEQGIIVIISNHDTVFTNQAYYRAKITKLQVKRTISCKGSARSKAQEILALFS